MNNSLVQHHSPLASSFRDPSGFLFKYNAKLYRQINLNYQDNYDFLISSGLYQNLIGQRLLITHDEVANPEPPSFINTYKIINPIKIPFISYPYEWSFEQLKDAALCTLQIQKLALDHRMSLKDASCYNIQFYQGQPILIDTLSFEKYNEGIPWVAYKQFCQHFLGSLVLMACVDMRLSQLLKIYLDGIPLDLTLKLLPKTALLSPTVFFHIYLHAKSQNHYSNKPLVLKNTKNSFSKNAFYGHYYDETNYSNQAFEYKKTLVHEFLSNIKPKTVWDLGANTGVFSQLASAVGAYTVSFDIDPLAVQKNYLNCKLKNEKNILPLVLDLTNPSSALGWENKERDSLLERGPVDVVMALALIHHLAVSNNLPLEKISSFFKKICTYLIIEFVPKSDSQVQRLLSSRNDIFPNYTQEGFEKVFIQDFQIQKASPVTGSERVLYIMKAKH
ncbi:MAG: SAM-dependent methyltransferase [Deltaproteobacteria bacterium]|nr:SAM-dependent methyltransferase [Deltaproteobacteria bacterium]